MSQYPQQMYVGNRIVNGSPYGSIPQTIVKYENFRYYSAEGFSWQYAISVEDFEKESQRLADEYLEQQELFEYTRNITHDC